MKMTAFPSKAATVAWFLRRPAYWPHLVELSARKFKQDRDSGPLRQEASRWASEHSIPVPDALARVKLLGTHDSLPEMDPARLTAAEDRAARVPMKLGGPGDLSLIYAAAALSGATRLVETGVAYGWSSLAMLAAIEARSGARLVSVDMPYPKMNNEEFVGVVVPEVLRHSWTLVRLPDRNGLLKAIDLQGGQIDFCHYDSDKSWYGRRWAYQVLWDALEPGGVFISDDIQDNFAFRDFVEARHISFAVTESAGKFVGICRK